jgi:hypothetical protein
MAESLSISINGGGQMKTNYPKLPTPPKPRNWKRKVNDLATGETKAQKVDEEERENKRSKDIVKTIS